MITIQFASSNAPSIVDASASTANVGFSDSSLVFLWIPMLLLGAALSRLVERIRQPAVLGELLVGVLLGNLAFLGIHFFEGMRYDPVVIAFTNIGIVLLLFQIGLESNIKNLLRVGKRAAAVAAIGVAAPFLLGSYVAGPLLFPNESPVFYLFLGATLTATSTGITARVLRDLGKLRTKEASIILGAAVIDDILAFVILAAVSTIALGGTLNPVSTGGILFKALLFLAGAAIVGRVLALRISNLFSKIHTGIGMKFSVAVSFGFLFAYTAKIFGLEPIIGAFAAGLVLDPVYFKSFRDPAIIDDIKKALIQEQKGYLSGERTADGNGLKKFKGEIAQVIAHHSKRHIEDLIHPLALFFVPIFFVMTGMNINLAHFFNGTVVMGALGITVVAVVGKIVAGLAAGKTNKLAVGVGMIPRGEVGIVFATVGRGLGIISGELFSAIILMVILTTFLTPPLLSWLLRNSKENP